MKALESTDGRHGNVYLGDENTSLLGATVSLKDGGRLLQFGQDGGHGARGEREGEEREGDMLGLGVGGQSIGSVQVQKRHSPSKAGMVPPDARLERIARILQLGI